MYPLIIAGVPLTLAAIFWRSPAKTRRFVITRGFDRVGDEQSVSGRIQQNPKSCTKTQSDLVRHKCTFQSVFKQSR
jgi:hypothetical protein